MKKGFTLIELVIVISILAILATVVVLVLNPAELLAQARDSQRMSDLSSIKSAIALYLATATSPTVETGPTCTATGCGASPNSPFGSETVTTSTAVDGNGWVKVNLTGTSGESPLATLPLDPTNSGSYFYAYKGENTNKTFELDGRLESEKYRGLIVTDGGDKNTCTDTYVDANCFYEIGTKAGLTW